MLVRIVKMTFIHENIADLEQLFQTNTHKMSAFEGCDFLELYQNQPNIFFTYSYWKNADFLENYRTSDFFMEIWSKAKPLFSAKPEAWSVLKRASLS